MAVSPVRHAGETRARSPRASGLSGAAGRDRVSDGGRVAKLPRAGAVGGEGRRAHLPFRGAVGSGSDLGGVRSGLAGDTEPGMGMERQFPSEAVRQIRHLREGVFRTLDPRGFRAGRMEGRGFGREGRLAAAPRGAGRIGLDAGGGAASQRDPAAPDRATERQPGAGFARGDGGDSADRRRGVGGARRKNDGTSGAGRG